jgi:septal ring factor EnvC (AmiA/AmiB activator)
VKPIFSAAVLFAISSQAWASVVPITDQLSLLRNRVSDLEQELIDGLHASSHAQANIKKIRALLKLQKQEKILGRKRLADLQTTVEELNSRKKTLDSEILAQRDSIRRSLIAVERSLHVQSVQTAEEEKWEAPRRYTLAALVDRGVKQIEALKIDMDDANQLEQSIGEEKNQLAYMLHDLDEQKGILELNQQLQADIIKKHHQERLGQLENYRKLKVAEYQVEDLVKNFNARVELEKTAETERRLSKSAFEEKLLSDSQFNRLKGQLKLPIGGKILTHYGREFDSKSGLFVFKKGIEIQTDKKQSVRAIYSGKIAFSGELPDYGRVTIIDHGDHFYSICAHLGSVLKKAGDKVESGELIGQTDDSGTPVYFEIRSRNVAVNPLQWVSN